GSTWCSPEGFGRMRARRQWRRCGRRGGGFASRRGLGGGGEPAEAGEGEGGSGEQEGADGAAGGEQGGGAAESDEDGGGAGEGGRDEEQGGEDHEEGAGGGSVGVPGDIGEEAGRLLVVKGGPKRPSHEGGDGSGHQPGDAPRAGRGRPVAGRGGGGCCGGHH